VFGLTCGVLAIGVLAVLTLGVSTTGRTLEDITAETTGGAPDTR